MGMGATLCLLRAHHAVPAGCSPRRCQAIMAHLRLSRSDSALDFQVKVLQTFQVVPASLGGRWKQIHLKSSVAILEGDSVIWDAVWC